MKEYRQNTKYNEIISDSGEEQAAEPETKGAGGHGNRYSLPYGLCESVGIDTRGMTPREAWDAWTSKTGRTKEDAEREHWGKTVSDSDVHTEKVGRVAENNLSATPEQSKMIDRFSEKFAEGKEGAPSYGGEYAKIVEPPTFSALGNGDIAYRIVGVRQIEAQKSSVIGVGDTPPVTRTTVSTGIIKKDGTIFKNPNEVTNKQNRVVDEPRTENDVDAELEQKKKEAIEYFRRQQKKKEDAIKNGTYQEREITSSTYKRAQNRLNRTVNDWFGNRRR